MKQRRGRPTIALVTDAIYPYHHGGKEQRYHELTRRLAGRAEVHVYTMNWWRGSRVRTDGPVTFHAISRFSPLYAKERRSIPQALLFAIGCLRLLGCHFDVLEADHIPYFHILVLRLVATLKRKRFVVTWHEVWGKAYWCQYLGRAGLAAWFIEWLAMRLPDHIVAASPETAERLRLIRADGAAVTAAPNGIDMETIRAAYPGSESTDLVVVGRLMPHKRVSMLLEAVALLHGEGLPVTCRVIGDGPERETLTQQAHALGLRHAVDFRHNVREQKDLYSLVKAARAFVFPSAREGFGIAVLEAIACGVPVVTTSSPDNLAQHLVARSGHGVVCEPSAAALAAAIKELLAGAAGEPGQADSADLAWLASYSWDAMTDRVAEALQI